MTASVLAGASWAAVMDNADAAVMLVVSGMDARECARRRGREHANDDRDERDETTGLRHVHLDPLRVRRRP
jgi:hypothetical protein